MQRVIYSEVMAEYRTPGMFNTNGIWQIGPMIIAWGTDEQKAEWLPSILEAEEHWCQGFSEPDGRQRPGQPAHHGHPTPTADEYVDQRLEDLDLLRAPGHLGPVSPADGSDRH